MDRTSFSKTRRRQATRSGRVLSLGGAAGWVASGGGISLLLIGYEAFIIVVSFAAPTFDALSRTTAEVLDESYGEWLREKLPTRHKREPRLGPSPWTGSPADDEE